VTPRLTPLRSSAQDAARRTPEELSYQAFFEKTSGNVKNLLKSGGILEENSTNALMKLDSEFIRH